MRLQKSCMPDLLARRASEWIVSPTRLQKSCMPDLLARRASERTVAPRNCVNSFTRDTTWSTRWRVGLTKQRRTNKVAPVWFNRCPLLAIGWISRIVTYFPRLPLRNNNFCCSAKLNGRAPTRPKNRELVATFVDRSVAIESLGDGDGFAAVRRLVRRDQLGSRPRAVAIVAGYIRGLSVAPRACRSCRRPDRRIPSRR